MIEKTRCCSGVAKMSPAAFLFGSCACRLLARTFLDYYESDGMAMVAMMTLVVVVVTMFMIIMMMILMII